MCYIEYELSYTYTTMICRIVCVISTVYQVSGETRVKCLLPKTTRLYMVLALTEKGYLQFDAQVKH